jgi:7,8-dihydropterin-6-yl-methyl-4-(beta-D-ribofuranosyl)aminobenzene 5'-phosphate synthase
VSVVVLSHGHWDHGNGLRYLSGKKLITHPGAFIKRFRKNDQTELGLALTKNEVEQKFELITTVKPYTITDNVFFLGEVPRTNDFESKTTPFVDAGGNEDFVIDDSAMAIVQNDALVIITGCSHAGICNIIEHAKVITGIKKVDSVIGGFHLKYDNHQTKMTIEYFKDQQIKKIYPSHCTELPALAVFYHHFGIQQVKTGMQIEL